MNTALPCDLPGVDSLTFVFFPQRAPLGPIWLLRSPTLTTPSSITCRRVFLSFCFFIVFHKNHMFPFFFWLLWAFFFLPCTSMLSSIFCIAVRKHSTAQFNQPAQNRKPSTCRSEYDHASMQTALARAHVVQHLHSTLSLKTNKDIGICPAYQNIQLLTQHWFSARSVCVQLRSQ